MTSILEHSRTPVDPDPRGEAVHCEQIDSVFRQLRLILGVDAASGTMLVLFALLFAEQIYLGTYLWIAVLLLNSGVFYLLGRSQISTASTTENSSYRERFLLAMVVASGFIWGSTWALAPISAEELVVAPKGATLIWFCLMLANATIVLSVNRKLFLSFAIPAVGLHVAFSLYQGSTQDPQIAGALIIVLAFCYFIAMRIGRDLNRTIRLRLRNSELDKKLSADEKTLKLREEELVTRIKREEALLLEKQAKKPQRASQ